MKQLLIILIPLFGLISCRGTKGTILLPGKVETQVERVIEVRMDTTYIEVPAQSTEIQRPDSTSHLETDFATSDARINPDGTLYHNLKNKPQKKPAVVPTTFERRDSIVEREISIPVYIDKPLNKVEQFKISAFWWIVGVLVLLIAILFRKPIFKLIMNMI